MIPDDDDRTVKKSSNDTHNVSAHPEVATTKDGSFLSALAVCLFSRDAIRAYIIIGVGYSVSSMKSTGIMEAEYLYEDMDNALHWERPIRARSDLVNIPIIGRAFQAVCDASDFVHFNAGLAKDYAHWVPVAATLPTVWSFASSLGSALSLPTMALLSLRAAKS